MSSATPAAEPSLGLDQTVGSLVAATTALESGAAIAGDLDRIFKDDRELGLAEDGDGGLTVIFTDLDRFQEYNDVYGLLMGDDLVRRTAAVLASALDLLGPEARLGHDGGDDFVVVSPRTVATDALREICTRFNREKLDLFRPAEEAIARTPASEGGVPG